MSDAFFNLIDDGIKEKQLLKQKVNELLSVINIDKDGDFFICKENLSLINDLSKLVNKVNLF